AGGSTRAARTPAARRCPPGRSRTARSGTGRAQQAAPPTPWTRACPARTRSPTPRAGTAPGVQSARRRHRGCSHLTPQLASPLLPTRSRFVFPYASRPAPSRDDHGSLPPLCPIGRVPATLPHDDAPGPAPGWPGRAVPSLVGEHPAVGLALAGEVEDVGVGDGGDARRHVEQHPALVLLVGLHLARRALALVEAEDAGAEPVRLELRAVDLGPDLPADQGVGRRVLLRERRQCRDVEPQREVLAVLRLAAEHAVGAGLPVGHDLRE